MMAKAGLKMFHAQIAVEDNWQFYNIYLRGRDNMRLKEIRMLEYAGDAEIVPWSDEAYDAEYDPWVAADQADQVASDSGIRVNRDKELNTIALVDGNVVGAIWTSLSNDEPPVFDFDVAVDPAFRSGRLGLQLIDTAIEDLRAHQGEFPGTRAKVWVINPKLVRVLENRYGFEIESQYKDGSAHMTFE